MINLSIPCHWNKEIINEFLYNNKSDIKIIELYWSLTNEVIWHWRNSEKVVKINRNNAIEFLKYLKLFNIEFAYTLNTKFFGNINSSSIKEYLNWIWNELKPNSITLSDHILMKYFRENFIDIKINISTIARVDTIDKINYYIKNYSPRKIIMQHDVNRDFNNLYKYSYVCKKKLVKIELMLNESCIRKCPWMKFHYNDVWKWLSDEKYHIKCNNIKLFTPKEILKANFIRPEDIDLYYKYYSIENYKITWRSKHFTWLPEVVRAYLNKNYDWNLIRLLWIDPQLNAESFIFVDNKSLGKFIINYPKNWIEHDIDDYCEKFIIKLFNKKNIS